MKLSSKDNKIWFTSDLHFFHKRILEFCPKTRPYNNVEEMNTDLISKWNNTVDTQDYVFILGDVSFGKQQETDTIIKRLNGNKILVMGNHDKGIKTSLFSCAKDYLVAKIDGIDVVMFHFPMLQWDKMHYGSYHLFGHVHGSPVGNSGRSMDVGWDVAGKLFSWEDVNNKLKDLPVLPHGG